LSKVCFTGPEDELRQTCNAQPAIFLHSIVADAACTALRPDMVAGHSLGEYSALVVAGALSFEDGLRLIRLRGELMQQAGEEAKGTMAALVGLEPRQVEEICAAASSEGIVRPANFNSPGQIVVSGSVAGVRKAMALAREHGAKIVKELVVSGAFHSPLMESAKEGLKKALDKVTMRDASIPVYANVTAEPVIEAGEIRDLLYRQITSPVQWEATVKNIVRDGGSTLIELGPGKILQGLVKRTAPNCRVKGIDKYTDIQQVQG
jgi:[acyl-carrier-protein] S-malonyltransferase